MAELDRRFATQEACLAYWLTPGVLTPGGAIHYHQDAMKNKPLPPGDYAAFVHVSDGADRVRRSLASLSRCVADWRRQAEAGDTRAVLALACVAATGVVGGGRDLERAAAGFRKAAEAGDSMAMFLLGEMYEVGEGVEKDPVLAASWFEKAAALGHAGAIRALKTPLPPDAVPVSTAWRNVKPYRIEAFGARIGNADAMAYHAERIALGAGTSGEVVGMRWAEMAFAAGSSFAHPVLAGFLMRGVAVPKDLKKAAELLLPGAEAGDEPSIRQCITLYEYPDAPGRRPLVEAYRWRLRLLALYPDDPAQLNDCGNACFTIAIRGRRARTLPLREIRDMLNVASLSSSLLARLLGALRLDSWRCDWFRKALGHYRRAVERHDPQALTNLGDFAFLGIGGEPRDEAEAFRRYTRGADAGDWHAVVNLGVMLCKGWGCEADPARGRELLRKAAQASGLAMPEVMLWICFLDDESSRSDWPEASQVSQANNEFHYPAANRAITQYLKQYLKGIVKSLACLLVFIAAALVFIAVVIVLLWRLVAWAFA
jgi:TPR repeat protein